MHKFLKRDLQFMYKFVFHSIRSMPKLIEIVLRISKCNFSHVLCLLYIFLMHLYTLYLE